MNVQSIFSIFKNLDSTEWTVNEQKSCIRLVNNYTQDEFEHQSVNLHSWHLLEVYKSRVDYCVPNTPQIILPKEQKDKSKIEILVQSGSNDLQKYLRKNSCQQLILNLFRNILRTAQMLVKKYGYFRFTRHMIRITSAQNFIFWINSTFSSNHRQFPLHSISHSQGAKQMTNDIISVFKCYDFTAYLQQIIEQLKTMKSISFQKIRMSIDVKLDERKTSIIKKLKSPEFLKNQSKTPKKQKQVLCEKKQLFNNNLKTSLFYENNSPLKEKNMHVKSHSGLSFIEKATEFTIIHDIKRFEIIKNQQIVQKKYLKNSKAKESQLSQELKKSYLRSKNKIQKTEKTEKTEPMVNKGFIKNSKIIQSNLNESSLKKNQFRQSSSSQATTNFFTTSITSSGKTKLLEMDNSPFFTIQTVPCLSPFDPQKQRKTQNIGKYNPRASKIIQQYNEDISPNNYSIITKSECQYLGRSKSEELLKDFDNLMKSQSPMNSSQTFKQLHDLESALDNILNG